MIVENKCGYSPKIKMVIFSKKGMARKAMQKNLTEPGRTGRLKKQIEKGTVIIYNP